MRLLPPEPGPFQFTLRKLLAFVLLCALFFAYTAWWMGRLRYEREKSMRMVEAARQQADVSRLRAEQAQVQAEEASHLAQSARARLRALQLEDPTRPGSPHSLDPEKVREMLMDELRHPTIEPGALDLMPRDDVLEGRPARWPDADGLEWRD